jgi:hypothetical protein
MLRIEFAYDGEDQGGCQHSHQDEQCDEEFERYQLHDIQHGNDEDYDHLNQRDQQQGFFSVHDL